MSEIQAAIEFQVELGKFYNVDLFQRGYYQLRTSLKMSPKVTAKVDASLSKDTECRLVMPGSVLNGVAISKTFQILYRKEDIDINDVIAFKVYMLVDMLKIDESIADADFQLGVELWFTEEDFSPTQQDKMQCLSQRTLKLHFLATKGIHHYVPLLFDYFHLSAICLTVHATLIALHQPYISLSRSQPRASVKIDDSLESALFGSAPVVPSSSSSSAARNSSASPRSRKQVACQRHRRLCFVLLSAYESIQTSFESLTAQLPSKIQVKIEHVDCRQKLEEVCQKCQAFASTAEEEDLFQAIQSDFATLCSQNVILWMQYLELVTLNEAITYQLAKEHHTLRVKRFSEGFFINEYPKQEMISCFDPNIHGHVEIAYQIRNSVYYQLMPSLAVECAEVDGDATTMPIIFEDTYSEPLLAGAIRMRSESGSKTSRGDAANRRSNRDSTFSDASTASGESSSSITRKSNRLKFIKNVRPESLKRPSSYINVDEQVAVDKPDCTLVGYRKLDHINAVPTPPVELGTLNVSVVSQPPLSGYGVAPHPFLYNAISLPTLVGQTHPPINCSGSLPDLALNTSPMQPPRWSKIDKMSKVASDSSCGSSSEVEGSFNADESSETVVNCCAGRDETLKAEGDGESTLKCLTAMPGDSSLVEASDGVGGIGKGVFHCVVSGGENEGHVSAGVCDVGDGAVGKRVECLETDSAAGESCCDGASLSTSSNHKLVMEQSNSGNNQTNEDSAECRRNVGQRYAEMAPNELVDGSYFPVNDRSESADNVTSSSSGVVFDCDVDGGLSGHCTVLELIKEEYERSQTEGRTSSNASSLSDRNVTTKSKDPAKEESEENGLCAASGGRSLKPCLKNGSELAVVSANSGGSSEKPQRLVDEVTDKIVRFISAKETLRKQLDLRELFYSDFPSQISSLPYFTPPEKFFPCSDEGIHLVVCVHGLDGNSTDLRLVRTYLELALPSNKVEFLMSERNQVDTFADFEVMTDRLVQEILYHIELYGIKPSKISFIGHSLGNLIIRSAMSRPQMTELLPKLHTFLSLSGPHLGTLFNSSGLVNMGMWLMQKWKKSGSLLQLSLKDHSDPRQTFLYKLSQKTGLEFFRNILLVGSQQDRYVPFHSSRIELCKAALRDTSGWGAVYTEMVNNILQPIIYKTDINFIRFDVFHALSGTTNHLIGRAAHIAVLDSELFIEKFITVAALKYFV